jgi:hypothetical protein
MPNAAFPAHLSAQALRDLLTRTTLDTNVVAPFAIHGLIDSAFWLRIRGLASFWLEPDMPSLTASIIDTVIGLHGMHRAGAAISPSLACLITGDGRGMRVHLGAAHAPSAFEPVFIDYLRGMLPGIEFEDAQTSLPAVQALSQPNKHGSRLNAEGYFKHIGYLTGIPTCKTALRERGSERNGDESARQNSGGEQIERVLRGMAGGKWGYLVYASPQSDAITSASLEQYIRQHTVLSQQLKESRSESIAGQNKVPSASGWAAVSNSQTIERTHRDVQYALELLDAQIRRIEAGRVEGAWSTRVYFFAEDALTATRVGSLLRACFSGPDSRPEPVRVSAQAAGGVLTQDHIATHLTSSEVGTLIALPQREFSGYRVPAYTQFDVDVEPLAPDALPIGKIAQGERATSQWLGVRVDDLSKHALVVGVTGSGKTTTIFSLLHKLSAQAAAPIPFLVVEPAKTEYRRLLGNPALAQLRIYTLGDERTAPFRLNPFEFEVMVDAGGNVTRTDVQTHIDYLKSVFNAAFVLYAPMPYVLDIALHEVYEQKGWNLATGMNHRLSGCQAVNGVAPEQQHPVFPTLSDLRRKVAEVVERMGYEDKIKGDVIAGLQARIDSLRLGAKGLMLDVKHGIHMPELLAHPTVLELERMGNDEEKAFLMGLLMSRIAAYRRLQGNALHLRHVTVIEEAHRLLKNVNTEVGTEEASNKAAAVEVFANMLSEIRAYGEGVIIAEQIPAKLAPDAIKNTNLKLMHRLLAEDDRASVGATINLSKSQSQRAVALDPRRGEVIAFAEGSDRPYLLRIVPAAQVLPTPPIDSQIEQNMRRHTTGRLYEPAPGFDALVAEPDRDLRLIICSEAVRLSRDATLQHALTFYLHAAIADPASALAGIMRVMQTIRRKRSHAGASFPNDVNVLVGACVCAAAAWADEWADMHGLSYVDAAQFCRPFTQLLASVARGFSPGMSPPAAQQLQSQVQPLAASLASQWAALTKAPFGPLTGCAPCTAKCAYRTLGSALMQNQALSLAIADALRSNTHTGDAYWREVAQQCDDAAKTITQKPDTIKAMRVCIGAHYGHQRHSGNPDMQLKLTRNLSRI